MIDRPVIIIGAPRSGTTILQRCLAMHPRLWHLRAESHGVLEGPFHPRATGRASNRCTAADATPGQVRAVRHAFYRRALNLNRVLRNPAPFFSGSRLWRRVANALAIKALGTLAKWGKPARIRFLEKTPKNTLRVSLLDRLFPDALYVWNVRRPADNIDSLVAGWKHERRLGPVRLRRFARSGYPVAGKLGLADYDRKEWKFAWVPGWPSLAGKTVADVAAWQYYQCHRFALKDFRAVEEERVLKVRHEEFVDAPEAHVSRILRWAGLSLEGVVSEFAQSLPNVNRTRQRARGDGGLRYPKQVRGAMRDLPDLDKLSAQLGY